MLIAWQGALEPTEPSGAPSFLCVDAQAEALTAGTKRGIEPTEEHGNA